MKEHLALPLYKKIIRASSDLNDPDNVPIGCGVYDSNGDYITRSLPESVCDDLIRICNEHYRKATEDIWNITYGKHLCYIVVEIEPMAKPQSQVVGKDKQGKMFVCDSPVYEKYIQDFVDAFVKSNIPIHAELPIDCKCQVVARFYCKDKSAKCICAYMEALLDCLVSAGIIKNKGHRIVNNMDGSRLRHDARKPRIEIFIRRWGNDNKSS